MSTLRVLAVIATAIALAVGSRGSAVANVPAKAIQTISIGFLTETVKMPEPVSPLDEVADDIGVQGARLGIADNSTTGRFMGQEFTLKEETVRDPGDIPEAVHRLEAANIHFIVADLPIGALEKAAGTASHGVFLLNTRAPDDSLRNEDCRASVLHVIPSRAMQADALAQYLVAMRWPRWYLIVGQHPEDALFAAAIRNAAKRFGGKIVGEKKWTFQPGDPHADSGHVTLQAEIPPFTRGPDHDVLIVADESGEFGDYLPYRTALPRPVAGTQGLIATAWSPVQEQWGGLQLQSRFLRQAHRRMTLRDYTAWLAVRAVGEGAARTHSADPATIFKYMTSDKFALGGFKGQPFSFRPWDGQLRQPMLIVGPRVLVSVSPQQEFLSEGSPLDSLGPDQSETKCRMR